MHTFTNLQYSHIQCISQINLPYSMYSQMSFWILSSFFQLHYSHRLQSWHPCPDNLSTTWPKKVELEEWIVHLVPQPSSSHIRTTIFCINDFGFAVDFLQYWNTTNRCCPQQYVFPLRYKHFTNPLNEGFKNCTLLNKIWYKNKGNESPWMFSWGHPRMSMSLLLCSLCWADK